MLQKISRKILLVVTFVICIHLMTGCFLNKAISQSNSDALSDTVESATVGNNTITNQSESEKEKSISNGHIIVLDAGHQKKDTSEKEPVGPGSSEMKVKDTSGASGVSSGLREYELNLMVAFKLQEELQKRGYDVIMTRTNSDEEISNIERAMVANNVNADAFIRIHANSVDDSNVKGAMTICQSPNNPYNANIYNESRRLSADILDEMVAVTGAKKERVWETDTMTGINWSQVPVTIVEMGYMSNPGEDMLMSTDDYQWRIVMGIANGVDRFISGQ